MDASVTARIPVRTDNDPRYFTDKYQALPSEGYTAWFEDMLNHPLIDVVLDSDFFQHKAHLEDTACGRIVYTGPIDRYFHSQGLGGLEYRSITFTEERHYNLPGYVQLTPVVNFPGPDPIYTRAIEYKHYLHRPSPHSIVVKETTSDDGEPYYPVPNPRNRALYEKYKKMAKHLEDSGKVIFVGRLANYKYFNMDQAINNALEMFDQTTWIASFQGERFVAYRKYIEEKMKARRKMRERQWKSLSAVAQQKQNKNKCSHPLWMGEFGMEMRVIVPWAYFKSLHGCLHLRTQGVKGSKYMYWFSDDHEIVSSERSHHLLPHGNPFGGASVHRRDFPVDTDWQAPPFKTFFGFPTKHKMLERKPLVVIENKYTSEWKDPPINFMSVKVLLKLLEYLEPKYTILYKRHTDGHLVDHHGIENNLGEKLVIGRQFPSVFFYEDVQRDLKDVEDQNLLHFGLLSLSDRFLSVQGGTAVVCSYFGGSNVILIKRGKELTAGDYEYFHRFSNATVVWRRTDQDFLDHVKKVM